MPQTKQKCFSSNLDRNTSTKLQTSPKMVRISPRWFGSRRKRFNPGSDLAKNDSTEEIIQPRTRLSQRNDSAERFLIRQRTENTGTRLTLSPRVQLRKDLVRTLSKQRHYSLTVGANCRGGGTAGARGSSRWGPKDNCWCRRREYARRRRGLDSNRMKGTKEEHV